MRCRVHGSGPSHRSGNTRANPAPRKAWGLIKVGQSPSKCAQSSAQRWELYGYHLAPTTHPCQGLQGSGLFLRPGQSRSSCAGDVVPGPGSPGRGGRILPTTEKGTGVPPPPAPAQTLPPGAMASQLEGAMETLINVFHHYSGKEGDKYKLSKKELKELLQSELGCFLETQKDTGAVEKIMQDLDENGDGEVDFQEYVVLVAALTVACNTFFWENA
ncbi:protein S100-A1 isoform X1 [Numida meleagris]|uniref:protein S100-A1 isoform X1 n=1 Tax=Numida meleagris TaxID=8996 RepID=UPI000B3D88DD|nr:protein S100-A1 isoform X1 [Numida meleagris]